MTTHDNLDDQTEDHVARVVREWRESARREAASWRGRLKAWLRDAFRS